MKRLTARSLAAAVAIVLAGAAGAALAVVVCIAATTHGTRWFLASVTSMSGGSLSVQKVEGKIIDHLLLTGVRVTLAQQKVELDSVELRWKPLPLFAGTVAVQELVLNGVRIQDDTPPDNKPPVLVWPSMPQTAYLFDSTIARLRVTNFSYRRRQEQPALITTITASVNWQGDVLSISDLTSATPSGRINGAVSAGFNHPSLTADLAITPARPVAEMEQFSLQIRHSSGISPEQLAGTIAVVGIGGNRKLLELGGEVGMVRDAFHLRRLHLTRTGKKGMITADGSLSFTSGGSIMALQVKAAGLDLAPELNVPTNLSGTLNFTGTQDNYRGNFTFSNRAEGWQSATVSAVYHGTREGMKLAPLTARVLDGSLAGNMDFDWRDGFAMRVAINGRNLNPARFDPAWKGVANFTATGELARSAKGVISGSVDGALMESSLHGQVLTGLLQADFTGNNLSVNQMTLQGKGFDLQASGELNRRLVVAARITDASRLVPGSAGTFRSDGWVRWRDGYLSGAVSGTGSKISYDGTQIAAAALTARLEPGQDYPAHVAASLRDVVHGNYKLNAVKVTADGTLPHHSVNVSLRAANAEARLALSAGYNEAVWKGVITGLAGNDSTGAWNLEAPSSFAVSAGKLFISPLVLTSGAAERIEIAANLTLDPPAGKLRAQLSGINLARLNPWISHDIRLEGRFNGRANGIMLPEQRFKLDGDAELSGGALHQKNGDEELHLTFTSATGKLGWEEEALTGTLSLKMAEYGQVQAHFQLPVPARFPVAANPKGDLRASLAGQLRENGLISALSSGVVQKSLGELDVELDVGGTWDVPKIDGKVRLVKGGAYLPTAGIRLQDIQLAAHMEKNIILIDSFRALSGPGYIEGTARLALDYWQVIDYHGTIRGKNFQIMHLPELQILSTPELTFEGTPQKLILRGELLLPEFNFIGAPPRTAIAPSSDVILEGRVVPPAKKSPLALDGQLRLLLGERVLVKVAGIDAQLGGSMELSFSSLDSISSRGEIKVVKGRYRTYGVNLEIVRGRLFFAGGPIDHPALDFLALRTIGDIRAGVTVSGTLQMPITRLYSEPSMPDVDVLAYIVLGHPLGNSGEQASLVNQAAGALLTSGQASVLQDQIKSKLGLSTLEIQGGVGGTSGAMGYKPLQVTAPGAIPATQQPGITETVLTVGKYLTPKLYISYGRSLFTGSNLFLLRYDIFKKWQIETQTGSESGADLFYKLEFK